jgi:hypothetical protein
MSITNSINALFGKFLPRKEGQKTMDVAKEYGLDMTPEVFEQQITSSTDLANLDTKWVQIQNGIIAKYKENLEKFLSQKFPENKDAFLSIINSIPYNQRTYVIGNSPSVLLTAPGNDDPNIFTINTTGESFLTFNSNYDDGDDWRQKLRFNKPANNLAQVQSIISYLTAADKLLNDTELLATLNGAGYTKPTPEIIKQFVQANPPLNPENTYKPVIFNDILLIINTANPRESKQLSDRSGKLVKANISPSQASRLLGVAAPAAQGAGAQVAAPVAGAGRRGRPPGVPNAPAAPAANVPAGEGISVTNVMNDADLTTGFNSLPTRARQRLTATPGRAINITNNRGASRRNNLLGNAGRVIRNISVGPSDIYIIRLNGNNVVASIVVQPGNTHYLVTSTGAYALNSPADLLNALQQRNLAEARGYIMNEYLDRNPHHKNEFKELIKTKITEKQK